MKKILALALLSSSLLAVDSTQIKIKTDGGVTGDAVHALAVGIARGTTAPASPVTGQLWLDTNYSPAILKDWNGSAWVVPQSSAAVQTQANVTSFPGSPVDGQMFYSKSPRGLYVYDSTLAQWVTFALPMIVTGPSIIDIYAAATMTAPTGAITATISATAGSTGAGAYSWKITCRNANGGETTVGSTSSNTVTPGTSKSADLASIPLCSTATGPTPTNRGVYRTKTAQAGTGPWYWVGNVADNSTTTFHDGAADGVGLAPDLNFSAALPGSWAVLNLGTSGGCGGTGASRGSLVCYMGALVTVISTGTSDGANLRASLSIASYTSANFTLQYRVKQLSQNGDTYLTAGDAGAFFGMRVGTSDNAARYAMTVCPSGSGCGLPFSSSLHGGFSASERTAAAGSGSAMGQKSQPYPQLDAMPFWVRWVRRGVSALSFLSSDGVTWIPSVTCIGINQTTANCSISTSAGSSAMDHVEIPLSLSGSAGAAGAGPWVEIDSFALTVP